MDPNIAGVLDAVCNILSFHNVMISGHSSVSLWEEFLIQVMPPTPSSGITRRSANTHMQY
jgi:hypothetical protein